MKQFLPRLFSRKIAPPQPQQLWFLHLPKTGGTTFRLILENHYSAHDIYPHFSVQELSQTSPETLHRYRLVRGHFPYQAFVKFAPPQTPYVTMLRAPLKRLASSYFHWKRRFPELFEGDRGFKQFVNGEICNPEGLPIQDGQNAQVKALASALPSSGTASGDLQSWYFNSATATLQNSLFVGITERFQESLELLCYTLKLCPSLIEDYPVLHQNKGEKKDASEMLNAEDLETLTQMNTDDSKLYHIALDLFEERYRDMERHLRAQYGDQLSIVGMLNCDYAAQYSHQPVRSLNYTFDQPLAGKGWHKRQAFENGWFRWTASPVATLELPVAKNSDISFKLEIFRTKRVKPSTLEALRVIVHGHEIACHSSQLANSLLLTGMVHRSILQDTSHPFVTFELHTDDVDFPLDSNKRKVGIAVQSVKLTVAS